MNDKEIYVFSEKVIDSDINEYYINTICPEIQGMSKEEGQNVFFKHLEQKGFTISDFLLYLTTETALTKEIPESGILNASIDEIGIFRAVPATKGGYVAMRKEVIPQYPIALYILKIYFDLSGIYAEQAQKPGEEIESVKFTPIQPTDILKSPVLSVLMSINNNEVDLIQNPAIDRFITMHDELYKRNPHGKVSINQIVEAYNANSTKSGLTPVSIEEMRNMIETYRGMSCIFMLDDGTFIDTIDNHLIDITKVERKLKINNKLVDAYYYIHRPSLISMLKENHIGTVDYVKIPVQWLDLGMRATKSNNNLIFYISKLIATKAQRINLDAAYKAAGALTPKQQHDTRKKINRILNYHTKGIVKSKLSDFSVINDYDTEYEQTVDAETATIILNYDGD